MKLAIIKLDSINKTVSGITEAVKKANLIASDIGKKVREANVRLRERISNANKDYQRRLDSSRKKQREELIEALGIGGAMRRTGQVIKKYSKRIPWKNHGICIRGFNWMGCNEYTQNN